MKGLSDAAVWAITKHYSGQWSEIGNNLSTLGAADNAVCLPTATWSLTGWTVEQYEALFADIVAGKVSISADLVLAPESTANTTVTYVE